MTKTEYSLMEYDCPTVDDYDESTPLIDGDRTLTSETDVMIVFEYTDLPEIHLHSDTGFTRRQIVHAICTIFQKAQWRDDHRFLETITVETGGRITFSLGS